MNSPGSAATAGVLRASHGGWAWSSAKFSVLFRSRAEEAIPFPDEIEKVSLFSRFRCCVFRSLEAKF